MVLSLSSYGLLLDTFVHTSVNEAKLLRVGGADAIVAPLADDAVEVRSHRINHCAGTAAVAVLALRFATGGPAGAVVHDRFVVVGGAAHDPVRFRNPIVVVFAARLDVLVVDGHELVAVPALMFVMEAEHVAEFVGGHPFALPPPEGRDVDVHPRARLKAVAARVVTGIGLAGEVDVLDLVGTRDEPDARAGVHPALHGFEGRLLLILGEFGNVVGNDTIRPGQRLFRARRDVCRIGIRQRGSECGQRNEEGREAIEIHGWGN